MRKFSLMEKFEAKSSSKNDLKYQNVCVWDKACI